MDFTVVKYKELLDVLVRKGFSFQTFDEFLECPSEQSIILRHDVDLLPNKSLEFAKIQNEKGIKGTYYFRVVPQSYDEKIILEISKLGHEIGYHYENLTTSRGNIDFAIEDFKKNLALFRELVEVKTICMHGSPMSKFDSKDLWKKFDYNDFGIIGEPYFDINFDEVFYLTDTGRCWDGYRSSVRDRVKSRFNISFHDTDDIIKAVNSNIFPDKIMMTFHPQRWHNNYTLWMKELIFQNFKNVFKRLYYVN